MNPFLLVLVAYLAGSVPTSFWMGKVAYGVDLRTQGSGNLGATNTFRVLGWKAALPVVVVDVAKGWLPVWLFPLVDAPSAGWQWAMAYGAAAIVGHVYSAWVRFRGGKGVATSAGVFLALAPWSALVGLLVFAATLATTRLVSLGSILAAVSLPVAVALTPDPWPPGGRTPLVAFTVVLAAFVVWAHRANVRRIVRGEERPIDRDRATRRREEATAGAEPAGAEPGGMEPAGSDGASRGGRGG